MSDAPDIRKSYLSIRKTIGILGIFLPFLILFAYGEFLPSISHYYYTKGAIFFIAILAAFGLFLISYKGYERQGKEISDNIVTIIGGICVLIVVLIPTTCGNIIGDDLLAMCENKTYPLYGHNVKFWGSIHLLSAGLFLFSMGWMSYFRFTRSSSYKSFYRVCGIIVWACILFLLLEFALKFHFTNYDVYILETAAVMAFGASWLIKGEVLEDMRIVKRK